MYATQQLYIRILCKDNLNKCIPRWVINLLKLLFYASCKENQKFNVIELSLDIKK